MIRISIGNLGSGKTACEVMELFHDKTGKHTYTNIKTSLKNCMLLTPQMIVKKVTEGKKEKYEVNIDFWKQAKKPLNVVLDEAHNIIDSRSSMSGLNKAVTNWQSSLRRVCGETDRNFGELVYITQIFSAIDVRTRELCTQIRYHTCHYLKTCLKCQATWQENSEMPEKRQSCISCHSFNIRKHSFIIEVKRFQNEESYNAWRLMGEKSYYARYYINDIEKYFPLYNTLQWDNLFQGYK